jgi:hypothetical protein
MRQGKAGQGEAIPYHTIQAKKRQGKTRQDEKDKTRQDEKEKTRQGEKKRQGKPGLHRVKGSGDGYLQTKKKNKWRPVEGPSAQCPPAQCCT